jgi:hypothetical protein
VKDDGHRKEDNVEIENYNVIESFTHLLTVPSTCVDDSLYGGNMY